MQSPASFFATAAIPQGSPIAAQPTDSMAFFPISMLPVLATETDSRELESSSRSLPAESKRLVTTDGRAYLFSILEPGPGIDSLIAKG